MLATYELPAVLHFTEELNDRRSRCDNGEGTFCNTLEKRIEQYVQMCSELRSVINEWAQAIFTGQIAFDQKAEDLLKTESQRLLNHAKEVAATGRTWDRRCFELQGLNELHYHVADFDYLLRNWVRPRLATHPAPRTSLSEAAKQEATERIETLSPLPSDWQPADPNQRAVFQSQRRGS